MRRTTWRTALLSFGLFVLASRAASQEALKEPDGKANRPQLNQQRIAELTELITVRPEMGYRMRALEYARGGVWARAAADWQKVVEFDPDDSLRWQQTAVLIVLSEDVEAYQKHCRNMIEKFGQLGFMRDLERTVKMCTLAPLPQGDLEQLTEMAEKSVEMSKGQRTACHHTRTSALVLYRNKMYESALEAIAQSDKVFGTERRSSQRLLASNRAIQALCEARRGNMDDAKRGLSTAGAILEKEVAHPELVFTDKYWHDLLIAKTLYEEAKQLLAGGGMGEVRWGNAKEE